MTNQGVQKKKKVGFLVRAILLLLKVVPLGVRSVVLPCAGSGDRFFIFIFSSGNTLSVPETAFSNPSTMVNVSTTPTKTILRGKLTFGGLNVAYF